MQQTKLKVLDLFSGIGGFSLGLESTGHFETIAFCEKDQFCQKVLQKNFKNIPIEGDVRNVKGEKYKADVVVGGFPCQSISIAGKQKGKVNRSSNQRVQITLSTDVAMEYLKNNPELIDQFDKPFMYRPNLPDKFKFIEYLKSQTKIKELVNNTDIAKTKIEHWFRKDNCFSYPSIDDWNKIKPLLKDIKFDKELTYEIEKDWREIE